MAVGRLFSTIRARMLLLYTLLFALAFVSVYVGVNRIMSSYMVDQRIESQREEVEAFSVRAGAATYAKNAQAMYDLAVSSGESIGGRVLILDMDGVVMADSNSALNGRILNHREVEDIRTGKRSFSYGFHRLALEGGSGEDWTVYYTLPIVYQSRNAGMMLVSVSIQDLMDVIAGATVNMLLSMLAVLFLLIVASMLVARWISGPIVRMTRAIREMSRGRFNARVPVRGASEMAEMGKTFNRMSAQLESVDKMRSEFVANASHELKTPLSAIKILTESLLYQENLSEETYKEFLSDINDQIDRLTSLLTDLLTLTRGDQPGKGLRYSVESLQAMVNDAVKEMEPLAASKHIYLTADETDIYLECDRVKLLTAIINLIENAIKYTGEGGGVRVSCDVEDEMVYISVTDTGMGIPRKDLPYVFERFYRVDKARSRDTGGSGLGLSIVKQICRLHGGDVSVASKENVGSAFTLAIPQRRQDK